MSKDNNEPAFPLTSAADHQYCGMSLRDYFAIRVFSASIAGGYWPIDSSREDQARMACPHADAMLAERAK